VELPLKGGSYKWGKGHSIRVFDATICVVETACGLSGVGEVVPLGPAYLASYAEGARSGIRHIAPHLIGKDALNINSINATMDMALKGHGYAKSALDMAMWDLLGKHANLPVCELLGGRQGGDSYLLYRAISQGSAKEMQKSVKKYFEQGYRKFQLKVGGDVNVDIERIKAVRSLLDELVEEERNEGAGAGAGGGGGEGNDDKDKEEDGGKKRQFQQDVVVPLFCDANTGWHKHQAMQVVNGVKHLSGVYIEQPCLTYEECLSVRQHCPLPFILDECIDDVGVLIRAINDKACDAINLKISKVGGLSKARVIRDLAAASGIPMNIEDSWGSDITTAAITHLAHSTHPDLLLCSTDFNSYVTVKTAETKAKRRNGHMSAPLDPGLGVKVDETVLGKAVFVVK